MTLALKISRVLGLLTMLAVLLVAVLLLPFVAVAADLAPTVIKQGAVVPVPYSWTGLYVGANAGAGVGSGEVDGSGSTWQAPQTKGALGGVQMGYNWQLMRQVVLGVETDFDLSGVDSQGGSNLGWLSTVRGRAGYVVTPNVMLYGTGGLAIDRAGATGSTTDTVRAGWTAGAGVEWAFTRNWSVKAEYLHYDVGSTNSVPGATTKVNGDIGRAGINWKF